MRDYLNGVGIKQRTKQSGDPNALGVVDRAILTLEKKLKVLKDTEGGIGPCCSRTPQGA